MNKNKKSIIIILIAFGTIYGLSIFIFADTIIGERDAKSRVGNGGNTAELDAGMVLEHNKHAQINENNYSLNSVRTFMKSYEDIKTTYNYNEKFNALKPALSMMLTLLSITTSLIVVSSFLIQLITAPRYYKRREVYHAPFYGISALIVESLGALIFILNAISINSKDYLFLSPFILMPLSLMGVILSNKGLKFDVKTYSAKVGIIFGNALIILSSVLFSINIIITPIIYLCAPG